MSEQLYRMPGSGPILGNVHLTDVPKSADAVDESYAFPLSSAQEQMWRCDRQKPGNRAYNASFRWCFEGPLNASLVEQTFNEIVRRHDVLRTTFIQSDEGPLQIVAPSFDLHIAVTDLRPLSEPCRDVEMNRLCEDEARQGFDLTKGPLIRVGLLRMADEHFILMLTLHHIICDGWSIGLIMDELRQIYTALVEGREPCLPELDIQFADYVVWQKEYTASEGVTQQLAYWKRKLAGYQRLEVAADFPQTSERTTSSAIVSMMLPHQLSHALKELSVAQGGTMFITTLAACIALLHLYTGKSDIAVGSPLAGRNRADIEGLIGLFVNQVVYRVQTTDDPRFAELMAIVRDVVWEALANQDVPFERVLDERQRGGEQNQDPFYSINFICQREYARASTMVFEFCGIRLSTMPSKSQGALYDLNFFMVEREVGWRLSLEYNTDRYSEATAQRMLENFRELLDQIANNPECRLSDFRISGTIAARQIGDLSAGATQQEGIGSTMSPVIIADGTSTIEDAYVLPASVAQKRFWLLSKVAMDSTAFHMPACVKLSGSLSYRTLEDSFQKLVDRHEILRTTFEEIDGELSQIVAAPKKFALAMSDAESNLADSGGEYIRTLLREEAQQAFDLARGPLFRARVFRLGVNEHVLVVTLHHIIADGWSQNILQRELWSIYESLSDNRETTLAPLAIQYGDFTSWQREWLNSAEAREHLEYWTKQLAGPLPVLNFPTDRRPTHRPASHGAIEKIVLPDELVGALKAFARSENVTNFMLMAACFSVLLFRYTSQNDMVIGSPVANRRSETESLIGPLAGPFALRLNLAGDLTFREVLKRTSDATMDALAHTDLPFEVLLERLKLRSVNGRNPLFQFYFLYQAAFLQPRELRDLTIMPIPTFSVGTPFEMQLAIIERRDSVCAQLEYNPDLFDAATICGVLRSYELLLRDAVSNPDLQISNFKGPTLAKAVSQPEAVVHEYVSPRNEDEAKLTQIWEMLLDLPRIGVKEDFFQLGGQSLLAAQLVSEVEKKFGATIDLSTLLVSSTIEKLALSLRKASSDSSCIVPLRASGDKVPLFCFHGGGGHVLAYREMADVMPDDQPVYGVRSPDLDGAQKSMSVEELAERYICEIREVQKHGPYQLCGMSFGGLLAYEVATKLAGEGEEIGVLALFDTGNPAYYRHLPPAKSMRFLIDTIAVRSKKYIQGLTNGDMAAIATYLREFFKRKWDAFFWNMNRRISRVAGRPMPKAMRDNVRMFDAVGTVYAPKFFSGKLILFRAEDRTAEYRHDPALGWDAVAQEGVDVLRVQGDHITIMEKPNVVDLVRQLSPLLNRADVQKWNSSAWSSSPPQRPAYYAENVTKNFADVDNRRTNLRMNIP